MIRELLVRYEILKNQLWHLRTLGIGENNQEHAQQLQSMAEELETLQRKIENLAKRENLSKRDFYEV